jgi:SRSO17 transposase
MFKIVRSPAKLNSFFRSLTSDFHWDHARYFRSLVLAMAFAWGRHNISNLHRHLDAATHRTRTNNFLHAARFDPAALLRQKAYEQLAALKLKPGTTVYLILDDSKKGKRGKAMEAVTPLHDTGRATPGHLYVTAVIRAGQLTMPFAMALYANPEHSRALKRPFRKSTELVAEMIRAFRPEGGLKVVVLFDSYYLCPTVLSACRERGYYFLSTLKDNRVLWRNGRKLKTGLYKKSLWRRRPHRQVRLSSGSRRTAVAYVDAGWLEVNGAGRLHVIFSKKNAERRLLGIVTDDPAMTAADLIRHYSQRWWIEVFFKDSKQLLGLGQYQNRPYRAAVIHLHLVCFAWTLLTHLRLMKARGAKAKRQRDAALRLSTAQAQNDLRRLLWQDLVQYLEEEPSGNSLVKELQRLLVAA